jgi:hypothetical protein
VTHMLFWARSYREGQSNGQYCLPVAIINDSLLPPSALCRSVCLLLSDWDPFLVGCGVDACKLCGQLSEPGDCNRLIINLTG